MRVWIGTGTFNCMHGNPGDNTAICSIHLKGLVKKFCLLPGNFLVVNCSVLTMGMDIHWTFTYTHRRKYVLIALPHFLFVMSEVKNDLVHRKRYKSVQLFTKTI